MGDNKLFQYLHLISNTNSPTPLDIWTASGKYIHPQELDQFAIGFFKNFDTKFGPEINFKMTRPEIVYDKGSFQFKFSQAFELDQSDKLYFDHNFFLISPSSNLRPHYGIR